MAAGCWLLADGVALGIFFITLVTSKSYTPSHRNKYNYVTLMSHVQLSLDSVHGAFGINDGVAIANHVGVALASVSDVTLCIMDGVALGLFIVSS